MSVPEAIIANQTNKPRPLKDSTVFTAEAEDALVALAVVPKPEPTPEALDVALALAGRLESAGSLV